MSNQQQEIREAIQAADYALDHLNRAMNCLKGARNWGVVDIVGGGFLSTLMKRGKVRDAQQELTQARTAMRTLAAELRDVNGTADINIDMGDFLVFADYFFDGLIADWIAQSRISAARKQVEEAIVKVRAVKAKLQGML